jgi:hypothetical protein
VVSSNCNSSYHRDLRRATKFTCIITRESLLCSSFGISSDILFKL